MVAEILLISRTYPGRVALVDDEDYERVSKITWRPKYLDNGTHYAYADGVRLFGRRHVTLHQFIVGVVGVTIRHKDRDGFNNQKANLIHKTASQMSRDRKKPAKRAARSAPVPA